MGGEMKERSAITTKLAQFVKSSWLYFVFYLIMGFMQFLAKVFPNYNNIIQIITSILYMYFLIKLIFGIKEVDYLDRVFKFTIIVVVNSPLLVYSIVLFIRTIPDLFIKVSDSNTWIGFAGSIIGGSLTLFAVIFAFILDKDNRDLELDRTQTPKIKINPLFSKSKNDESMNFIIEDIENNEIIFNMFLEVINISNYPAQNISINKCELLVYSSKNYGLSNENNYIYKNDLKPNLLEQIKKTRILFGGYSVKLPISIQIKKEFIDLNDVCPTYILKIELVYNSQFEKIRYKINTTVEFDVSCKKLNNLSQTCNIKLEDKINVYILDVSNELSIDTN